MGTKLLGVLNSHSFVETPVLAVVTSRGHSVIFPIRLSTANSSNVTKHVFPSQGLVDT